MTQTCQLTEIPLQDFPELIQFYHHFPEKYPFLLSTTSRCSSLKQNSSYDILFIKPDEWLKLDSSFKLSASAQCSATAQCSAAAQYKVDADKTFLEHFDRIFKAENKRLKAMPAATANHLPFSGGWFIFFAYELAQQIEPCLNLPLQEQNLPIAYAARVRKALILDHRQEQLFFLSEAGIDHKRSYNEVVCDSHIINKKQKDMSTSSGDRLTEENDKTFLQAVKRVKAYIKEGDVFQVNLSRLWKAYFKHSSFSALTTDLYRLLSIANPAPFSGMASFTSVQGSASIISSSPERLLKIKNNQLESRPIAGTHPRSTSIAEDLQQINKLHAHPKEKAEHIMLLDLIRNDLGKVCVPGSVRVNELMVNETYAHVHHIVSNVIGQLQTDTTPGDAIKALFPGGTITGCPKVRCMEIIAELEQQARGAYTGSMGYINLDGSMDLNILIRTMVLEQNHHEDQQQLSFRAGAGLVFDSIADKELQETRAKAMGLLRALDNSVCLK